jgi:hypothetical protein
MLTIKNISAGVYFHYQYGASYYNQTLADYVENADINYNVDARALNNRWTRPGDVALYKAFYRLMAGYLTYLRNDEVCREE